MAIDTLVANAGADIEAVEGEVVTLDGSRSKGPKNLIFSWAQVSGWPVTLSATDQPVVSFVAPEGTGVDAEPLVFILSIKRAVSSPKDATHTGSKPALVSDEVSVYVKRRKNPPAAGVLTVSSPGTVTISGTEGGPFSGAGVDYVLSNAGGSSLNWKVTKTQAWIVLPKVGGTLAAGASEVLNAQIGPEADSLLPGSYTETLTFIDVSNGNVTTKRRLSLNVVAGTINSAPTVDAGNDQAVVTRDTCRLHGTVSDDGRPNPPGAVLATWSVVSGPGTVTLGDVHGPDTTAAFAAAGTYELRLSADDGGRAAADTVTVYVVPALTIEASATSGPVPLTIQFTARTDDRPVADADLPTGNTADLRWDFGDGDMGQGAQTSHVYALGGTYRVTLYLALAGLGLPDIGCSTLTRGNCEQTILASGAGALTVEPSDGLVSTGIQGGMFSPSARIYSVRNTGGSPIVWTVGNTQPWVSLSKTGGTLTAGGLESVLVVINDNARGLASGTHSDVLSFVNTVDGTGNTTRSVSLTLAPATPTAATPTITPGGGTYTGSVQVSLACATSGATIRYTTDGTDPTSASAPYTGPITLTGSATVKARASAGGCNDSAVASAGFTIESSTGQTYYVATTGSDSNPGTLAAPFRTIQSALNRVSAGDTVVVGPGTYEESLFVQNKDGAPGSRIVLQAASGTRPVIDPTHGIYPGAMGLRLFHCDYWTVQGFEIVNQTSASWAAVHALDTQYLIVQDMLIHDCAIGIYVGASDHWEIGWNEIHDCNIGIKTSDYTLGSTIRANYGHIHHNLCHDMNGGEGGDGIIAKGGSHKLIEYNLCWQNDDDGIDNSASGGGSDYSQFDVIRYNACWRMGKRPGATDIDGNGIKVSTNAGGDNILHHNIVFDNSRGGLDCDQESDWGPNRFYHNTVYGNDQHGLILDMAGVTAANSAATAMNNLLAGNGKSGPGYKDHRPSGTYAIRTSDYNFIGDGIWPPGEGAHSLIARNVPGTPRLANPGAPIDVNHTAGGGVEDKWWFIWNQIQANFALLDDSPCRNAGATVSEIDAGALGAAPDIGAIESAD